MPLEDTCTSDVISRRRELDRVRIGRQAVDRDRGPRWRSRRNCEEFAAAAASGRPAFEQAEPAARFDSCGDALDEAAVGKWDGQARVVLELSA